VRRALRALPTLVRVGLAEAMAYRAEMLIWLLSTTMPLVMLALMTAVAREAPVGRFGQADFAAYYLAALVVRLNAGAWVIWELNFEIRQGTLAYRLLRPIHPLVTYAASNVGYMPLRLLLTIPVAIAAVVWVGPSHFTHDPALLAAFPVAVFGGWLITFLAMALIGALAFRIDNSTAIFEIWLGLYMLLSGYLVPLEFFPAWLAEATRFLPFRYMLAFPVELVVGLSSRAEVLRQLLIQLAWIGGLGAACAAAWRAGLRRFSAFGG
jgi:ABC-2 type transport system permease protein